MNVSTAPAFKALYRQARSVANSLGVTFPNLLQVLSAEHSSFSTSAAATTTSSSSSSFDETRLDIQQPMRMDLSFAKSEEDNVRAIVTSMVPEFASLPASERARLEVSTISGGITNKLFRCSIPGSNSSSLSSSSPSSSPSSSSAAASAGTPSSVLLRVFGGEGIIDRDKENATVAWLAANGQGPKYYGRFGNGRIEGWLEGASVFSLEDLSDAALSRGVAGELGKFHGKFQTKENKKTPYIGIS